MPYPSRPTESSEAGDPHGLAAGKSIGDDREDGAHLGVGAWLGHGPAGGREGGTFGLVHPGSPSGVQSSKRITLLKLILQRIAYDDIPTRSGAYTDVPHGTARG